MPTINLPVGDGRLEAYRTGQPKTWPAAAPPYNRIAFAAAHVVADPFADNDPWLEPAVDWDATMAFRRHLWGLGLGVAEAMDTAQRGMGLDWPVSRELIARSVEAARDMPGAVVFSGAGTDHLQPAGDARIEDVIAAYEQQIGFIEGLGGRVILMASRALAACARGPEDYSLVYDRILDQVSEPVIIHWLGEMFDPALAGYWGSDDHAAAMETCLGVLDNHAGKIDGIKISLLDKHKEISMRRRLPAGVRMYSGDDFNYPELIAGDTEGYSDALLGIFDCIAPAAAAALGALSRGDRVAYDEIMEPTVPLARHVFKAPTRFYKTGVVFMAYLNGMQDHFVMVGGQQSARSLLHLAELFRLSDAAGLLADPDLAAARMQRVLAVHGLAN